MTRAPRLSARMRALEEAAQIAERRANHCREAADKWERDFPDRRLALVSLRAAHLEAVVIACQVRERMQEGRTKP